jgi:hypothetical protein
MCRRLAIHLVLDLRGALLSTTHLCFHHPAHLGLIPQECLPQNILSAPHIQRRRYRLPVPQHPGCAPPVDDTCWAEVCFGEDVVEGEVTVDEVDVVAVVRRYPCACKSTMWVKSNGVFAHAKASEVASRRAAYSLFKWTLEVPKLYD